MTAPDIVTEARQLLDAATPGPWEAVLSPNGGAAHVTTYTRDGYIPITDRAEPDDATLIAAAPRLVTELVAEVERLRAALDQRTDPELAGKFEHAAQALRTGIAKDCDRCPTNDDMARAARLLGGEQ